MTTTIDIPKLESQANELRGGMRTALDANDDTKLRKLGNELNVVLKQILDGQAEVQVDARNEYQATMYDALKAFEIDGLTLTIKFQAGEDGATSTSVLYVPVDATIEAIKAAVASVDRPSTATKWAYAWEAGEDGQMHPTFDMGKGARKVGTSNGTRSVGWTTADGADITLGDAFDASATKAEKAELATKSGGSATNAYKVKTITGHGYSKK